MLEKIVKRNLVKWSIAIRILPLIAIAVTLKILAVKYEWVFMELNALFTSMVAGTIFLISFLVQGVLSDYKESEKIPSELAATLKSLYDDTATVYGIKNLDIALEFQQFQKEFLVSLHKWLHKQERTSVMMKKISEMNTYFIAFDKAGIPANYIIKMKTDQNTIRRILLRIDTIRDTDFIGSAYAIVEAMGIAISLGLVVIDIQPLYAAIFFIALVTFLIFYMLQLIKDLDNPFDYASKGQDNGTEISLKPLEDLQKEFSEM